MGGSGSSCPWNGSQDYSCPSLSVWSPQKEKGLAQDQTEPGEDVAWVQDYQNQKGLQSSSADVLILQVGKLRPAERELLAH